MSGLRPVVIVTSNREKQLPEPFLRRCLYVELKFPDDTAMLRRRISHRLRSARSSPSRYCRSRCMRAEGKVSALSISSIPRSSVCLGGTSRSKRSSG